MLLQGSKQQTPTYSDSKIPWSPSGNEVSSLALDRSSLTISRKSLIAAGAASLAHRCREACALSRSKTVRSPGMHVPQLLDSIDLNSSMSRAQVSISVTPLRKGHVRLDPYLCSLRMQYFVHAAYCTLQL